MKNETVKLSIFKQNVYENQYRYDRYYEELEKFESNVLIRTDEIFRCDIPMPLLEINTEFYIEEIDRIVEIVTVIRTSKDNVLYRIRRKNEDSENTETSKQIAEQVKEKYFKNKEIDRLEKYNRKSWIYRLFHNYKNFE